MKIYMVSLLHRATINNVFLHKNVQTEIVFSVIPQDDRDDRIKNIWNGKICVAETSQIECIICNENIENTSGVVKNFSIPILGDSQNSLLVIF